jgi:hypothetical protein
MLSSPRRSPPVPPGGGRPADARVRVVPPRFARRENDAGLTSGEARGAAKREGRDEVAHGAGCRPEEDATRTRAADGAAVVRSTAVMAHASEGMGRSDVARLGFFTGLTFCQKHRFLLQQRRRQHSFTDHPRVGCCPSWAEGRPVDPATPRAWRRWRRRPRGRPILRARNRSPSNSRPTCKATRTGRGAWLGNRTGGFWRRAAVTKPRGCGRQAPRRAGPG